MSERRETIAGLYYRSGSIKVDIKHGFELSVHRDQPDLPKSPWYMHYPQKNKPGSELMPELEGLVGEEFHEMSLKRGKPHFRRRIAGLPMGALGIAREYAILEPGWPYNHVTFEKYEDKAAGTLSFSEPKRGIWVPGDELEPCEDHITGARNNLIFVAHARSIGFQVVRLNVVVDRQQGATEALAREGVELNSIFTGDDMLAYGLAEGYLTQTEYDMVQGYREENQYALNIPAAS